MSSSGDEALDGGAAGDLQARQTNLQAPITGAEAGALKGAAGKTAVHISPGAKWLHRPAPKPEAPLRLFCFPYAGAGASVFFPWIQALRDLPVELVFAQLPGRESRIREAPFTTLAPLVASFLAGVQPYLDQPFCLFGHSVGTLICFELMRELRRRGGPLPIRALMSGSVPPNKRLGTTLHQESDDQILAALADRYGTLPEGLRQCADLREVIMPVLRADLALLENYQYQAEPPFAVPLTIIGGLEDRSASPEGLRLWSQHTQAPVKLRLIPGGHFYLRPPPAELIEILREDLAECAAQVPKLHPLR